MNLDYCSACGNKTLVKHSETYYTCTTCSQPLFNNPRATVAVLFMQNEAVLYAKRGIEPNKNKYDFPGGFIEYNEDPFAACIREVMEETGVQVRREDLQLVTAYTLEYLPNISVTDLLFVASSWSGTFTPADDVAGLEWKPIEFTDSEDFAPSYPGLAQKLHNFSKSPL